MWVLDLGSFLKLREVGVSPYLSFIPILSVLCNVLKTGPVAEPEKLPVHGSLVGPVVEPWLNR